MLKRAHKIAQTIQKRKINSSITQKNDKKR